MWLRTTARDCLYLNWALPRAAAPDLPAPLRYDVHQHDGDEVIFASALLFRLGGLRLRALPLVRLSYPQMNLRLYVSDGDGVPSVLFRRMLVPGWVTPVSRLLARQPARSARFDFPPATDRDAGGEPADALRWSLRRDGELAVEARLASPTLGEGPGLGSWERTVDYFRNRPRGYVMMDRQLRSLTTSHPRVSVWPLAADVREAGLVAADLPAVDAERWRRPHSSWLCPEIPFLFQLGRPKRLPQARRRMPARAAVDPC